MNRGKVFVGRPGTPRCVQARFWQVLSEGSAMDEAARRAGITEAAGKYLVRRRGGVRPRLAVPDASGLLKGRFLGPGEREQIMLGHREGLSAAAIGRLIGRDRSTVSRELKRNSCGQAKRGYLATVAQAKADRAAARPKQSKLAVNHLLHGYVQDGLKNAWSPEQVSRRLVEDFPEDGSMRISHETIYLALFVQGRGELRRELTRCLRTGRTMRRPHRRETTGTQQRFAGMVSISERPAEAQDRAVPGHWEGDLILGKDNRSAIGTLVERTTRYVLLLHLAHDHSAATLETAMRQAITTLPDHLWRSLTWDQGSEMAHHHRITLATGLPIYFCDPHSPWQRGSNENTNGLLRQYFPKGSDLSPHSPERLAAVAVQLNGRPRKTLNWRTPAEKLNELLSNPYPPRVATTA